MRLLVLAAVFACVAVCPAQDGKQDPKKEIDLTWKLGHDKAAIYDVWDVAKKSKRGEFWLLGCELDTRVGAMDSTDLPYRFLFRLPKRVVKVGEKWDVKEMAFADSLNEMEAWGATPVEIAGQYRLKALRDAKPSELLKAAKVVNEDASSRVAELEGVFAITRCRQQDKKWIAAESKPSATLAVVVYVRAADSAVVCAKFQWSGRVETWKDLFSTGSTKAELASEVLLREPSIELTRAGLKPRIDAAIEAGAKWLKKQAARDGRIGDAGYGMGTNGTGATALALMALLHSGVPADDPVIKSAFAFIGSQKGQLQTYDVGPHLMAIEAKYLPFEKWDDIEGFSEEKARQELPSRLTKEDKVLAEANARWLISTQGASGAFGYWDNREMLNLSNSQYALLGLKSASRLGISIPSSVWKRALGFVENTAVSDGVKVKARFTRAGRDEEHETAMYGWQYLPPKYHEVTGTMTTAALSSMALCRSELMAANEWSDVQDKRAEEYIRGGVAWLQQFWSVRSGTPEGAWHLATMPCFYLYSLERTGILLGVDRIDNHAWYCEGAAALLSWQQQDGSWASRQGVPIVDTAFALLFLKRATIAVPTGPSPRKP